MKKRRNKLIAHYDLHTIATEAPDLLKWPTEEEISTVITLLIEAMNTAEGALGECRYDYDFSGDSFRKGAELLIDILNNYSLAQVTEPEGLWHMLLISQLLKKNSKPPDNPPPDHTDQTAPHR